MTSSPSIEVDAALGHVYVCFYNRQKCVVAAMSSLDARNRAAELFKVKPSKRHMIGVVLAQKDGEDVAQSPAAF